MDATSDVRQSRLVVLPRARSPTVPGTPGHPENRLFLLALFAVSGVPGTVGEKVRLGHTTGMKYAISWVYTLTLMASHKTTVAALFRQVILALPPCRAMQ